MNSVALTRGMLAAEGGYQSFTLGGGEMLVLVLSGLAAVVAILVGLNLMRDVLAYDQGTPKMIEIATAIQVGAAAYLKRQFRTIAVILVPLAAIVFITSTEVLKPSGEVALTFLQSGTFRTLAFIAGAILSGLTGYIGMTLATRGNVRTAAAAKAGSLPAALKVAFRTGGIAGKTKWIIALIVRISVVINSGQCRQVGGDKHRRHTAGFDPGEFEQRIHQLEQPELVAVHRCEILARQRAARRRQRFLGRAQHQRQRRPELVADVVEEGGLRAIELGELFRAKAGLLVAFPALDSGAELTGK